SVRIRRMTCVQVFLCAVKSTLKRAHQPVQSQSTNALHPLTMRSVFPVSFSRCKSGLGFVHPLRHVGVKTLYVIAPLFVESLTRTIEDSEYEMFSSDLKGKRHLMAVWTN